MEKEILLNARPVEEIIVKSLFPVLQSQEAQEMEPAHQAVARGHAGLVDKAHPEVSLLIYREGT